jgi:hypothetical protein
MNSLRHRLRLSSLYAEQPRMREARNTSLATSLPVTTLVSTSHVRPADLLLRIRSGRSNAIATQELTERINGLWRNGIENGSSESSNDPMTLESN